MRQFIWFLSLFGGVRHISALKIDAAVVEEEARPKNAFHYESNVAELQRDITVLLLGSSVDRLALKYFCESVRGAEFHVDKTFTQPLVDPNYVYVCDIAQRNVTIAYMFIPGAGPPPYWGCHNMSWQLCGTHVPSDEHLQHATTDQIIDIDAPKLATRTLGTLAPTIVVAESSLWDLTKWWSWNGSPPMDRYETPNFHIQEWCTHEMPELLKRVRRTFPSSQVLFRTPPTVLSKDHPVMHGETPEAIESLAKCIRAHLRADEIFDYRQLVDDLLDQAAELARGHPRVNPGQMVFNNDGRHPGQCAGIKYFHALLSQHGMRQGDFRADECLQNAPRC